MRMKLIGTFFAIALFLLPQSNSYADGFDLQLLGVSKGVYGHYHLGSMTHANTAAGLLNFNTSFGLLSGFCVEDVWGTFAKQTYHLIPVADGTPYETAAFIASQYFSGAYDALSDAKNVAAAVQLAIWKTVLGVGEAVNNSALNVLSSSILGELAMPADFNQSGWFVASNEKFQDYLVHHSVTEPATMLLLGLGLIGLAGYGRRTFKN